MRIDAPSLPAPAPLLPAAATVGVRGFWSRATAAVHGASSRVVGAVVFAGGAAVGAAKEGVNALASAVNTPIYTREGGWFHVQGRVWEPTSAGQRAGAGAVEAAARAVGLLPHHADRAAQRAERPLLVSIPAASDGRGALRLELDAVVPGAAWGSQAATCGMVSVYVDGVYRADAVVLNERTSPLGVNLGLLPSGPHTIELRDGASGSKRTAPVELRGVRISSMSADQTLVARHQPLIEGRNLGLPGTGTDLVRTDTPLDMQATVTANPDGTRTIRYYALMSNEDGGTSTARLYRDHGRATDFENLYTVQVGPDGMRLGAWYQGPRHAWRSFTGVFRGERAQLQLATSNNMVSERTTASEPVWSPSVRLASHTPHGLATMLDQPWTFRVMATELLRENRIEPKLIPDPLRIEDPRRYVYLPGLGDDVRRTLEQGGAVQLELTSGQLCELRMTDGPSRRPGNETAIPLPIGVRGDDVVGMHGVDGALWVLDGDLAPRRIATR